MKKMVVIICCAVLFSGCGYFKRQSSTIDSTPSPLPSALSDVNQPILDGNIHNILITENNFGTAEITVLQDEPLILSVRNQLQEPVNVVIDELGVRSKEIGFGELVEITIPTNKPGEYEMYSSIGDQRTEGFSAMIIVDEGSLEE